MRTTRRTALKAMAAILMAPCVTLRPSIDREALLAAFCDDAPDFSRFDLNSPFSVGSLTYGVDYTHAIRAELTSVLTVGERHVPNMPEVWRYHWKPGSKFRGLDSEPKLLLPSDPISAVCPECGNRRISFGENYPDEATMDHLVNKHNYDVDDNTYQDPSCGLCHGLDYTGPCEVELAGVRLRSWRAKPILALPDLRIAKSDVADCLLFTADGFEGIAMGTAQV